MTVLKMTGETTMTMTETKLSVPTIHMNGTHPDTLLDDICSARDKVREAITALSQCAPNGRDYYQQGIEAFAKARDEHIARLKHLHDICAELGEIAETIVDASR